MAILTPHPEVVEGRYLADYLNSPFNLGHALVRATGTTRARITRRDLATFPIPLPPIPTQRKIASVLSAYDDLIANNLRRIEILEAMAQAIYREWFVEFRFPGHEDVAMVESELGPIPEGWEVVPFDEAVEVDPRTPVVSDEKPFVPMSGLSTSSMIIGDITVRSGKGGSKFRNGDTLFARITPSLEHGKTGFVQFLPEDDLTATGSTEFIVLRSRTLTPELVYLLARSEAVRDPAIKSMTGASGRQRVQKPVFSEIIITQPPDSMLSQFDGVMKSIFRAVHVSSLAIKTLRSTRDLLLPKLVSGEIDVSDLDIDTGDLAA